MTVLRRHVLARVSGTPKRLIDLFDELTDDGIYVPMSAIRSIVKTAVERREIKSRRLLWQFHRNATVWLP